MKKVLVMVHLLRATPRVEGLIRHLPEFGWQPIILTGVTSRRFDLPARIVETPYQDALGWLGRLLRLSPETDARQQIEGRLQVDSQHSLFSLLMTAAGAIVNYPCPDKNWQPFAVKAARKLIQEEKIDAIISTSAPVIGHIIASKLKAEYGVPWIADLRDLWSQNHNYTYGPIRRMMDRRLELKTLAGADALTTVSEPWAEKLRSLHQGKPVYTILHGFNPSEVNEPPAKLTDKFTITYTGLVHQKHDPSKLLSALRDLVSTGVINPADIEVRFYGPIESRLDNEIKKRSLSGSIRQYGIIPQKESLKKQRESQLLLVMSWEGTGENGVYSGKIFEYLGAKRPILATGGSENDVVGKLLSETKVGTHVVTVDNIANSLEQFYREYKVQGKVSYRGEESEVNKYSHREMVRKFSQLLASMA